MRTTFCNSFKVFVRTMEDDEPTIEQLRERLAEAEAAADAFGPTPQQLRDEAAAAEQLAKENGVPPKSAKVVSTLRRRWSPQW